MKTNVYITAFPTPQTNLRQLCDPIRVCVCSHVQGGMAHFADLHDIFHGFKIIRTGSNGFNSSMPIFTVPKQYKRVVAGSFLVITLKIDRRKSGIFTFKPASFCSTKCNHV